MKKANSGIIIFLIIIAISIGLIIYSNKSDNAALTTVTTSQNSSNIKKIHSDYIAGIYLEGEITQKTKDYDQKWILSTIEALKNDDKNLAIALFINSPGGSVYEADEVYLKLLDYKSSGKKLYVYQGALAASGGYYISCAADMIYANRNTLTGSIGVIAGQTFDISGFLNEHGIKSETIHAGKNKNMGNYNEPLTSEQRAILQSIADECYEQFTTIVSTSRNINIEDVKALADGRVYTAKQALNLNLIDKIDTYDNMISNLRDALNNQNALLIDYKVPEEKNNFLDILGKLQSSAENINNPEALLPETVKKQLNSELKYPAYLYNY